MRYVTFLFLLFFSFLAASTASRAASTDWVDLNGARARMVAKKIDNKIEGYVQMELDRGWKTYWRNPGDSGIPPEFDFSKSIGIKINKIEYSVPELIELDGGMFIGYREKALFFFSGEVARLSRGLELKFFAGLCEKICIPASAEFSISAFELQKPDLTGKSSEFSNITNGVNFIKNDSKLVSSPKIHFNNIGDFSIDYEFSSPQSDYNTTLIVEPLPTDGSAPSRFYLFKPIKTKTDDMKSTVSFFHRDISNGGKQKKFRMTLLYNGYGIEKDMEIDRSVR